MIRRLGLTGLLVVLALSSRVAAHGEGGGTHTILGPAAFVLGVLVVGLAVAADARDAVAPGVADLGVGGGLLLSLAGLVVYYVA